jgi:hypothetical protein
MAVTVAQHCYMPALTLIERVEMKIGVGIGMAMVVLSLLVHFHGIAIRSWGYCHCQGKVIARWCYEA